MAPLVKYLDEKLALLNASLVKENLSRWGSGRGGGGALGAAADQECPCRVLEALWELLLQAILQALSANLDVSADFYGRFHFTLEVGLHGGAIPAWAPGPFPGSPGATLCRVAWPSRPDWLLGDPGRAGPPACKPSCVSSTWATPGIGILPCWLGVLRGARCAKWLWPGLLTAPPVSAGWPQHGRASDCSAFLPCPRPW